MYLFSSDIISLNTFSWKFGEWLDSTDQLLLISKDGFVRTEF